MISAHDAEVIAVIGDGAILHTECIDKATRLSAGAETRERDHRFLAFDYWDILAEDHGLSALSRFDINEYGASVGYDYEMSDERAIELTEAIEALEHTNPDSPDLDDLRVELEELVEAFSVVSCDECGKEIG